MIGIVDIGGGFGNQLFQYSFAVYLKKIGYKVFINDPNKLNYFNPKVIEIQPSKSFNHLLIQKLSKNVLFKEYFCNYYNNHSNLTELYKGNKKKYISFFNGYWQKNSLVNGNEYEIQKLINSSYLQLNLPTQQKSLSNLAMIHVRRTDYLINGEALSLEYYEKSIKSMQSKKINNFYVYTDDEKWVKKQKIFYQADYIEKTPKNLRDFSTTVKTFHEFQNFENFIISNSTFSWWAAKLATYKNGVIISPKPFFLNENNQDLNVSIWETINR